MAMIGTIRRIIGRVLPWQRGRQKDEDEEEGGGHRQDQSERLLVRALQTSPFLRVPRTPANEAHRVRSWTNGIRTSLYRWWNFIPMNLFQQVIIPSNSYFIVMAILQLIGPISDSGGVPTFLVPLSFVMLVTMLKDAYEDIKRHRSDTQENSRICQVLNSAGEFVDTPWRDLKPGDIVCVRAEEPVPADLVMISCSDPYGIAYVGTVQLDGETNLKDKTCLPEMMEIFRNGSMLGQAKLELTYGPPNAKIYSFSGILRLYSANFRPGHKDPSTGSSRTSSSVTATAIHPVDSSTEPLRRGSLASIGGAQLAVRFTSRTVSEVPPPGSFMIDAAFENLPFVDFPVNINQFLWRGATLSNTDWVFGFVTYTGHHTRIFRNSKSRGLKYSKLLRTYNRHAIVLACSQFSLCLVAATIYAVNAVWLSKSWYLLPSNDPSVLNYESEGLAGFLTSLGIGFGRFVLLLSYFVPITLFVQLEIVKWCQAWFLTKDQDMISQLNGTPATVQTVSLMEELGSVTHVFSDKTGTLTLNLMQLRCIGVGSTLYGFDDADDPLVDPSLDETIPTARFMREPSDESDYVDELQHVLPSKGPTLVPDELKEQVKKFRRSPNSFVDFDAWMMLRHIARALSNEERERMRNFLLVLSLCHSVLPRKGMVIREAATPEEERPITREEEEIPSTPEISSSKESSQGVAPLGEGSSQRAELADSAAPFDDSRLRGVAAAPNVEITEKTGVLSPTGLERDITNCFVKSWPSFTDADHYLWPVARSDCSHGALTGRGNADGYLDTKEEDRRSSEVPSRVTLTLGAPPGHGIQCRRQRRRSARREAEANCSVSPANVTTCTTSRASRRASTPACPTASDSSTTDEAVSGPRRCLHWGTERIPRAGNCYTVSRSPGQRSVHVADGRQKQDSGWHSCCQMASRDEEISSYVTISPRRKAESRAPDEDCMPEEVSKTTCLRDKLVRELPARPASRLLFERRGLHSVAAASPRSPSPTAAQASRLKLVRWSPSSKAEFDASSPDEMALVSGAMHLGVQFLGRPNLHTIQVALTNSVVRELLLPPELYSLAERRRAKAAQTEFGTFFPHFRDDIDWDSALRKHKEAKAATENGDLPQDIVPSLLFDILEVLEFDNVRKKMSVVMRDSRGLLRLLTKGADSSMFASASHSEPASLEELKVQLQDLSKKGLRTLVFGFRFLSAELLQAFRDRMSEAKLSGSDDAVVDAYNWLEQDLVLVGCTGIDDKLQPQVPQTIEDMRNAGIRLWVLTGDKLETAVSIGHSCNVLTESTYNAIISGSSEAEVKEQLHQYMTFIVAGQLAKEAFDQMLANQTPPASDQPPIDAEGNEKEEAASASCTGCLARTLGPLGLYRRRERDRPSRRKKPGARPSVLSWDDFLKAITFQAKHKPVVSEPQQVVPAQLTPQQVDALIEQYLRAFDVASSSGGAPRTDPLGTTSSATTRNAGNSSSANSPTNYPCTGLNNHVPKGNAAVHRARRPQLCSSVATVGDPRRREAPQMVVRASEYDAEEPAQQSSNGRAEAAAPQQAASAMQEEPLHGTALHRTRPPSPGRRSATPCPNNLSRRTSVPVYMPASHTPDPLDNLKHSHGSLTTYICRLEDTSQSKDVTRPHEERLERLLHQTSTHSAPPAEALVPAAMQPTRLQGSPRHKPRNSKIPSPRLRLGTREVERFTTVAITCTGEALGFVLQSELMKRYFFGLANLCATVIACRVTPRQKAEVVRQASKYLPGTVSLGIGDGANDVGMIITANVGVGICGREGMQAVRAADFAISEFRLLKNLLFLHGHENLRRNSIHVYQTVYKNVLFGVSDWYIGFFSAFSAVDIYNAWLKQIFNLFLTPFPPLLFSVFDRMLPADIFLNCPWLYPIALRGNGQLYFGKRKFLSWFAFGLVSAVFSVVFPIYALRGSTVLSGVIDNDIFSYGQTVFYTIVIISNVIMVPFFHTWFWFIAVGYVVCFAAWFLSWGFCSAGAPACSDLRGSLFMLNASYAWHLTVAVASIAVVGLLVTWWFYKALFFPSPATIIRERIAKGVFDVVVAPKKRGGLAVVVPRHAEDDRVQWRGFAFSEGMTRLQLHRRLSVIPKTVVLQTAALGTAAGGLFYGAGPGKRSSAELQETRAPESRLPSQQFDAIPQQLPTAIPQALYPAAAETAVGASPALANGLGTTSGKSSFSPVVSQHATASAQAQESSLFVVAKPLNNSECQAVSPQ